MVYSYYSAMVLWSSDREVGIIGYISITDLSLLKVLILYQLLGGGEYHYDCEYDLGRVCIHDHFLYS